MWSRGRRISHKLVDPSSILTTKSNPLPHTKILEYAVIRIEEDTTIESFGDSTNREEVGREAGNIKDIMEWEGKGGSGDAR